MNIFFCLVDYIEIYKFARLAFVLRNIIVGHNIAAVRRKLLSRKFGLVVRHVKAFPALALPHLEKHFCKSKCRRAFYHNARVLPMPQLIADVYIFIGKVYTSRERGFSVYNQNLSVVAVILKRRQKRRERAEHAAFYSH